MLVEDGPHFENLAFSSSLVTESILAFRQFVLYVDPDYI